MASNDKKVKIFIVDDDKFLLDMYAMKFEEQKFKVSTAFNAQDALAKLSDPLLKPDILLLDIVMPGMDGFEVAKNIRRLHGQKINLIALTGYGQQDDKQKARAAGFDHHLTKPVSVGDVKKLLKK